MPAPLFTGIIPARYASTRFPGKPLVLIHGITMIERVYRQACQARSLAEVVVATDDHRIYDHVTGFGGTAVMTSPSQPSGTDRCREAAELILDPASDRDSDNVVINIQGDEPFLDPRQIDQLAGMFLDKSTQIATLVKKITDPAELADPNVVKVVVDRDMQALYFSRSAIPYQRQHPSDEWLTHGTYYKHIGIYAYTMAVLRHITSLPPSPLELSESLEQLRWLENGFLIRTETTDIENIAVDTPADLLKIANKK
jgi:3-deoxy-manno-octulosonate cytidylyltransferase (CMP-KDO synthetase)